MAPTSRRALCTIQYDPDQGTLAEGGGSVQLTSLLR